MIKRLLFVSIFLAQAVGSVFAQHLDEVIFGNSVSETKHGLTSYAPSKSVTGSGLNNQTYRSFTPYTENPFQGGYQGIYGGEINITVKVDGSSQNYFTVKFSGSESSSERIIMEVEGKEVGNRYHSNEDYLLGEFYNVAPGAFCFRTVAIPRSLTDGKQYVNVRLRSTGRFYGYGTSSQYGTFQRAMEGNTLGLYKLFIHTNPGFTVNDSELAGTTPDYSNASANSATLSAIKDQAVSNANSYFRGLLNGTDYIKSDPNNYYHPVEALAVAYFTPQITATYQKQEVIDKLLKLLDNMVKYNCTGDQKASASWGGAFGRQGYAMSLIFDHISKEFLDEVVDLGYGSGMTRREQWIATFRESFNYGAANRKTITNQEMENAASIYGAAIALYRLDPKTYSKYPEIGLRMVEESCGVKEFTGNVSNLSGINPQLGIPSSSNRGAGYYWMTQKGTSHEPGWVGPDCYGNLGGKISEMYMMTVHHLGGEGDMDVLQKGVQHVKTQAMFTYPSIGSDGKKDILGEGYICYRNQAVPGESFYTNSAIAGLSNDAELLGYLSQALTDGRLKAPSSNDFRMTSNQFIFTALDALEGNTYSSQMPTTPGQPDFVMADEENGVVSIKDGDEHLFLSFYFREGCDNRLVRGHHIARKYERFFEVKTDKTEARYSDKTFTRSSRVNGFSDTYGNPPDNPVSANEGEIEYYNTYDGTHVDGNRLLKDYYLLRYGRYLIAMNTLAEGDKTIDVPTDLVGSSARLLSTTEANGNEIGAGLGEGTEMRMPKSMTIPARTTYVFILDSDDSKPGLLSDTREDATASKTALEEAIAGMETFVQDEETIGNISLVGMQGGYKPSLFLNLMRQISYSKTMVKSTKATQVDVDNALAALNQAYTDMTTQLYAYDPCMIPDYINFDKKTYEDGTITIGNSMGDIGSTRQGAYVVIPVQAKKTGKYIFKVNACTTRDASAEVKLNLALLDADADVVNYNVTDELSKSLAKTNSWSDFSEYKWTFNLNEGDIKQMRLTFLVKDAGWCANVKDIEVIIAQPLDDLKLLIEQAETLLSTYSNKQNPEYAKVSDEDRIALEKAIEEAKVVVANGSESDFEQGLVNLQNAIDAFIDSISDMILIPGAIALDEYLETVGGIVVNDATDLGSTQNNAAIIFKVRPRQSGDYIPYIEASTNTSPSDNPRVNFSIGQDIEELKSRTVDEENSVYIQKDPSGWGSYENYEFPATKGLKAGEDYYVMLRFLTSVHWCANMRAFGMNFDENSSVETMGINTDEIDNDAWYNLQGIRIENPMSKGIYIHRGKKIIIR